MLTLARYCDIRHDILRVETVSLQIHIEFYLFVMCFDVRSYTQSKCFVIHFLNFNLSVLSYCLFIPFTRLKLFCKVGFICKKH